MIQYFQNLPVYQWINISLVIGCFLLCLILWFTGVISQQFGKYRTLPRVSRFPGSTFPTWIDEIYVLIFMAFFSFLALTNIFAKAPSEPSAADTWLTAFINMAMYFPFALRYMTLPMSKIASPLRFFGYIFLGLLVVYATSSVMAILKLDEWLIEVTGSPKLQQVAHELAGCNNTSAFIALCFSAIIVAPIMEEFAFRGFLYNVLRQRVGLVGATLASALLFSAIHVSLVQAIPLFIFGCVQCILYEKTQSIRACIILHMIFNTIATIVLSIHSVIS
jgi:membrane protease YdiL (CAAX protease family)